MKQTKKSKPTNRGQFSTMTPEQELKSIEEGERVKASGPAYGFEGKTVREISLEYTKRSSRIKELKRQAEE